MGQPHDLDQLLEAAAAAAPGVRIQFRDSIAAHGASAIPHLQRWLADDRLSAFAVRTLEKIAVDATNQGAVLQALGSVESRAVSEWTKRDVENGASRITGIAPRSGRTGGLRRGSVEEWPRSHMVSPLEIRFHEAMLDVFRRAGEATRRTRSDGTIARGYWASYFLRGVRNHGGPDYARQLLRREATTEGFQRLKEEGRLDLTMEAVVLKPEYAELFTDEERSVAAHRLAEAGYQPSKASAPS